MKDMETLRAEELQDAQSKAVGLFREIEGCGLIRAAITERDLNDEIFALAKELYGTTAYRHKCIVRAVRIRYCPTLRIRRIASVQPDDILFLDLRPAFDKWDADFGPHLCARFRSEEAQTQGRRSKSR